MNSNGHFLPLDEDQSQIEIAASQMLYVHPSIVLGKFKLAFLLFSPIIVPSSYLLLSHFVLELSLPSCRLSYVKFWYRFLIWPSLWDFLSLVLFLTFNI